MKILGVDEAGRGPVIGSMFVGGFLVEDYEKQLQELGVKDSKKLSDQKRESIREQLDEFGESFLREIEASEIDELREIMSLNEIEIKAFTEVIARTEPDRVIVDLPEPDGDRFIRKMKAELPPRFEDVEFIAEHGADDEYPVVSAASIVAKSARESHIDELKQKYGYDFKSGYSHEPEASEFLEEYLEEHGELPSEARESWETAKRVLREHEQSSMGDF
ncbi:MAG: ribonuclease HII [Candidatus Nanohaloarchaea archaeon]